MEQIIETDDTFMTTMDMDNTFMTCDILTI
jgi:hypothetical protein